MFNSVACGGWVGIKRPTGTCLAVVTSQRVYDTHMLAPHGCRRKTLWRKHSCTIKSDLAEIWSTLGKLLPLQ